MSAEVLREAARLMRERAEGATPGPWDTEGGPDVVGSGDSWVVYAASGEHERSIPHIASWHPAVALAVADWLDSVYRSAFPPGWESHKESGRTVANIDWDHALTVARAYLGEER